MKSKKLSDGSHVLLVEKGEEFIATVDAYCRAHNLVGGRLQAIGAAEKVRLKWWDTAKKANVEDDFSGGFEVTGFTGTITDIGVHVHGTLSDRQHHVIGGHIVSALVNPMLEVFLTPTSKISRKMNEDVGLNLLDL